MCYRQQTQCRRCLKIIWLNAQLGDKLTHGGLLGRRILIVDEVDDTRTTLMCVGAGFPLDAASILLGSSADCLLRYLIRELKNDIEQQLSDVADEAERKRLRNETKLGIFVVHNK
jgi:hypothetical protein